jgi:hypothetical protein
MQNKNLKSSACKTYATETMAEEGGDDKKGLFHKLKALKRRTAQVIAHKIGGAENTIDEL